jgi:hypothetical protein
MLRSDSRQPMSEGDFFLYSMVLLSYLCSGKMLVHCFCALCSIELQTGLNPSGDGAEEDLVPIKMDWKCFSKIMWPVDFYDALEETFFIVLLVWDRSEFACWFSQTTFATSWCVTKKDPPSLRPVFALSFFCWHLALIWSLGCDTSNAFSFFIGFNQVTLLDQ